MRNFIMNIPDSLLEASEVDGANDVRIIFQVVLPLSIPALATLGLFYAVGQWNSWWDAYLFVGNTKLQPMQLILRNILASNQVNISQIQTGAAGAVTAPSRALQNAAVVVATVPIVLIYPFLQKYFIKGIMIGAVKG